VSPPREPRAALADLADVLAAYRTCELATVTRTGTPVTWPAVCWHDRDTGQIVLTTSIGVPRKAFNIRRDSRVALLCSDPTGSDRDDLPQVLVQGTAHCPDEIRTSPQGLEAYWRELWRRQPGSSAYGSTPLDRWLFDFYYMRLVITVTPTRVTTSPPLVRAAPLRVPRPARRDDSAYAQVTRQLAGYSDGVLATVVRDEPPVLRRVRPVADPASGTLLLQDADPAGLTAATTANLLLHRHDDQLGRLRQLGAVGALEAGQEHVALRPTRLLAGPMATTPLSLARTLRRLRRTTQDYLDRRGLSRPVIPWADYHRLASGS
jgi:general stress protein 26